MYSQCPDCLTRFRVPAAALRAAHGTVRCGRCGSAFDALPRLSDTLQADAPASVLGEPVPPGATTAGGLAGATAVGLLSADDASSGPEFHFSADDIEQVFVDVRDWQSRFGASSSPGDRAGLMGDTSSAELVGFLKEGETGEEDDPNTTRTIRRSGSTNPNRSRTSRSKASVSRSSVPKASTGSRRISSSARSKGKSKSSTLQRSPARMDACPGARSRSCPRSQPSIQSSEQPTTA
ncbi:MAG: zinc-ribbon domain-containing protein [Proteobacteria bacterium]|nr:zinc-ribbon domain-containing protein [Pseudomonadota bacterium]